MKGRIIEIKSEKKKKDDKPLRYELLCKGFCSNNFFQKYFEVKKGTSIFHLDYLFTKEVVRKEESEPQPLQIFNLKKISTGDSPNIPLCEQEAVREFKALQEEVFDGVLPFKQNRQLCRTLNWTDGFLCMTPYDSVMIGLGNSNVAETSMTIHHTYGIPYIPGQAIKGVFRNYFLTNVLNDPEQSEKICKEIDLPQLYQLIFGDSLGKNPEEKGKQSNTKGRVVFFDAFPYDKYQLCQDIMTPHYSQYYADKTKAPMDIENPIPIPFFTVKNANFVIHYAIRNDDVTNPPLTLSGGSILSIEKLNHWIKEILQKALEEHGIGAKTAVGYGVMVSNTGIRNRLLEEEQKELAELKKKLEEAQIAAMSRVEKLLYEIKTLPEDQKESKIPNLMNQLEDLTLDEQKVIAQYVKEYYKAQGKWKLKQKDMTKGTNFAKRVIRICEILGEELPFKGN